MTRDSKPARAARRHLVHALLGQPGALAVAALLSAPGVSAQALHSFAVARGPLSTVLSNTAATAGVMLSADASLTQGLASPGVQGRFTAEEGLSRALAGTGLQLVREAGNVYTVHRAAAAKAPIAGAAVSTLSTVLVTSSATAAAGSGAVEGWVAKQASSGTKTDTPLLETPWSVSVVPHEQLEAQQPKTIAQALRYTPGITAELAGPQFVTDQLSMRGFQQGTGRMLRNGLRTFLPNYLGWDAPEPYGLERIDVLRGASSVLYGATDPGGQINLVSKKPTTETLRQVQVQAGNLGYRQAAFDLGGRLDDYGVWSYRLTGLAREADSQTDFIHNRRQFLAPALTWRPNADTELTLLAEYQRQTGNFANALPASGTVLPNPRGSLGRNTYVGEPGHDHMDNEKTSIGYSFSHKVDRHWTLRQNMNYGKFRHDSAEIAVLGSHPSQADQYMRYSDSRQGNGHLFTLDTQAEARFATGNIAHTLLGGLDIYNGRFRQQQALSIIAEPFDLFRPVYGQPLSYIPFSAQSFDQKMQQTGVYMQDQMKIDRWVLLLGARHDRVTDRNSASTPVEQKDSKTTARAGAVYLFDSGLAPYVSYSESFLPTVGTTASGARLLPETGKQWETGVKYAPPGSNSLYTAAVFELRRQNVTETVAGFSRQEGEVRSRGLELEARTELAKGFNLIGSYTWNNVEVTQSLAGNVGRTPFRTPEHMASVWTEYVFRGDTVAGWRLGGGLRYVGSSFGDTANTFKVGGYTVVDAMVSYPMENISPSLKGMDIAINASNLFDKKYVAGCFSTVGCQYGQQRTVYVSATYNW